MNRQSSLKKYGCDFSDDYPVSNCLADSGLYLPSSSHLTEDQIINITQIIRKTFIG